MESSGTPQRSVMVVSKKNMRVVSFDGPPCRRCGCPTEVREHKEVTAKELARPFYYTRWFNCLNRRCRTTLIMPEEFKVINDSRVADRLDDVVTSRRSITMSRLKFLMR
jgi:hypothetical protein